MTKNMVQDILMDFKYQDLSIPEHEREEKAIHVFNVIRQSMKDYPVDKYRLIYQVTKVSVINHILDMFDLTFLFFMFKIIFLTCFKGTFWHDTYIYCRQTALSIFSRLYRQVNQLQEMLYCQRMV